MGSPDSSGAETFAHYAVDILNHASTTADVSGWSRLAGPACETCAGFASDIEATGPDPGGAVRVESTKAIEVDPGHFYTVAMVVEQAPFVRPDGSSSEGGRFALLWALRYAEGWTIEAIDVGPPDAPWAP